MLLDRDMPNAGDRGAGSSCEIHQAREKYELEIGCRCEKCDVRSVRGDISSREPLVSSSGKTLFVLIAGGLVTCLPDCQSPS